MKYDYGLACQGVARVSDDNLFSVNSPQVCILITTTHNIEPFVPERWECGK
jgi:hypothetical protein